MTSPPSSQSENALAAVHSESDTIRKRPRLDDGLKENLATAVNQDQRQDVKAKSWAEQGSGLACYRDDSDDDDDDPDGDDDSSVEFLYKVPAAPLVVLEESKEPGTESIAIQQKESPCASTFQSRLEDEPEGSANQPQSTDAGTSVPTTTMDPDSEKADTSIETAEFPATKPQIITPLTSAYLQNLAEICWTILYDQRWRVGPLHETLFQWERGEDLSVVLALARRFIQPQHDDDKTDWPCSCLLCQDDELKMHRAEQDVMPSHDFNTQQSSPYRTIVIEEEDDDRCLHLYCRLFYRKGPWFRFDDLYRRYYTTKCKPSASKSIDEASISEYVDALKQLLDDVSRLSAKGFIASFSSEEECGKAVDEALLSNAERGHVLLRMAAGNSRGRMSPCPPGTAIRKQMKSQRPLFPGTRSASLPVKQHVVSVLFQSLSRSVLKCACPQHEPTVSVITEMERRIKSIVAESGMTQLVAGFCLRAEPFRILARCARLYLCAVSGPGSMRGDGANGWRSLLEVPSSDPIAGIRFPGIHAWHSADYPGLKFRFGLASFPFQRSFRFVPVPENGDLDTQERVFNTQADFVALECSVELRAHVDFALELDNALRYNERRVARGLQPLGNSKALTPVKRDIDILRLKTQLGRETIVRTLLNAFHRSDTSILPKIEFDIELYADAFESECHKILFTVATIAIHVLCLRNETIGNEELKMKMKVPWLRHLWWDGNLAYILWDTVPVLEKVNHAVAVKALEALLYGKRVSSAEIAVIPPVEGFRELAPVLLSRRSRGKAFLRLFVDYRHLLKRARGIHKDSPAELDELKARQVDSIRDFFHQTISPAIVSASIPFSSVRELAKPLKQPLSEIMREIDSLEVMELGYRLHDLSGQQRPGKFSEWLPTIDTAVANAIANDENGPGSRCAYVGFEDRDHPSSLNVEELAMEHYHMGRLPSDDSRGGWRGFHDEGSHVHSLFRIICAAPILGTGWGCGRKGSSNSNHTIHLSPYQGSPFDLLVGHERWSEGTSSFYHSRRERIGSLLFKLERLTCQEIADVVYDSVMARRTFMHNLRDPTTMEDMARVRTLSLVAAGLGGKALSSIFRCLCFDYRHFRGGMPDLLLVRATAFDDQGVAHTIDLGDFIGESFSAESQQAAQRAEMILGGEDFLGCSMGDSGGSSANKRNRSWTRNSSSTSELPSKTDNAMLVPERLLLFYNERCVTAETMLVEVKSANDRLDPRQHDWLNVMSAHADARVCKFEKSSAKTKTNKIENS